jgi:hypothetical protein
MTGEYAEPIFFGILPVPGIGALAVENQEMRPDSSGAIQGLEP